MEHLHIDVKHVRGCDQEALEQILPPVVEVAEGLALGLRGLVIWLADSGISSYGTDYLAILDLLPETFLGQRRYQNLGSVVVFLEVPRTLGTEEIRETFSGAPSFSCETVGNHYVVISEGSGEQCKCKFPKPERDVSVLDALGKSPTPLSIFSTDLRMIYVADELPSWRWGI